MSKRYVSGISFAFVVGLSLGCVTLSYAQTAASSGALCITMAAPASGYDESFYAQVGNACQQAFGQDYNQCVASGAAAKENCASYYTSNPTLAFNCGMPESSPVGYCLGAENPATTGCVAVMSPAQLEAALGGETCAAGEASPQQSIGPDLNPPLNGSGGISGSTSGTTTGSIAGSAPTSGTTSSGANTPQNSFSSVVNSGITTDSQGIQNFFSNGGQSVSNVLVTVSSLNVRSAPNTAAALAGSKILYAGDTFTATNEVTGESVTEDGVTSDLWWVSSLGNYVWAGGGAAEGTGGGNLAPEAGSTAAPHALAAASNPSIASVSYSAATGILFVDGTFDSSGNTVSINGQSLSNNGADQTASLLQIPIDQSNNGSAYNAVTSGTYTVTVKDSEGSATFAVSPGTAPVLTSVQGYNPTTNVYETTAGILNPGDTYIILYGTFAVSGNGVTLGFGATAAAVPASQISYQSATQINVSLGSLVPTGTTSFTVITYNTGSPASSNVVTVAVSGAATVTPATIGALTQAQVLAKIQSASSLQQAIAFAEEAAFTVNSWSGDGVNGATISDPKTGEVLANITEYIDLLNISTSPVSLSPQFMDSLAVSESTRSEPANTLSSQTMNGLIQTAFAATNATAVGNDTGRTASCTITGTNNAAHVIVFPSGQIYGGGSPTYAFSGSLGGLTDGPTMIANAQNFINGLGAAQLTADANSNSQIQVQLQPELDGPSGVALAVSTLNSSGAFSNSCTANVSEINLASALLGIGTPGYQQFTTNVITHEVLHCMGLAHSSNPSDIMFSGDFGNNKTAGIQWATSPPSIDPAEVAALKQIAAGQAIQVEDCDTDCLDDQGYQFNANGTEQCVDTSDLCTNPATLWNDQTQSCETCQQIGYGNGWIADQDTGVCALGVDGGVAPQVPLEPPASANSSACYCTSAGAVCLDDSGNEVAPPSGFSCTSSVPPGEVCTCFAGGASCADTNGNPVAVPSDFSCGSSSGSSSAGDDTYAQYACISNACTYVGQGPDYSDPSCGGGCSGD